MEVDTHYARHHRVPIGFPLANLSGRAGPYVPPVALAFTAVSAILSIIGAFIIFYSYSKLVHQRNTVRLLLVYLSAADLLTASGNLAGTIRYKIKYDWNFSINDSRAIVDCMPQDPVCTGQSFVTTFSSLSSFFWTVVIAIFFYVSVVKGTPKTPLRFFSISHAVCWGIPAAITMAALACDVLGEDMSLSSGAWCWINACVSVKEQIMWMFVSGKGWEILTYVISAVLFLLLKYNMVVEEKRGRLPFQAVNSKVSKPEHRFRMQDRHFVYIPLMLYLLRMWGTIRFFIGIVELLHGGPLVYPKRLDDFLLIMHCIGDSGQCFMNCLVYCILDKPIRQGIFCCKSDDVPDTMERSEDSYVYTERTPLVRETVNSIMDRRSGTISSDLKFYVNSK